MNKILIFLLLLLGINNANAQKTISFEAEGNLESPTPCDCVELLDVTNENNPADILIGMGKCMESKQFEKAARLFMIAGVYGKYDAFRVKDRSAHQAILVLQQNILLNVDESDRNSLMNSLKKYLDPTSEELTNVCQVIQQIGIPKYYPKYMVQHGIQAFLESEGNGLNMEFDSEKSWNLVLKNYLHCGE